MGETTNIAISLENWQRLNALKKMPNESFDDVLGDLLDHYEECEMADE